MYTCSLLLQVYRTVPVVHVTSKFLPALVLNNRTNMHLMQNSYVDVRDAQLKNVSKFVGLGAYRPYGQLIKCGHVKIGLSHG